VSANDLLLTQQTFIIGAGTLGLMRRFRFSRGASKDPPVAIGDPRFDGWETVSTFEDQDTAVAWRDQLRTLGLDAGCVADHPLTRWGRGDIYVVVPRSQWSRANEILENL
jgi:hypothetical protein